MRELAAQRNRLRWCAALGAVAAVTMAVAGCGSGGSSGGSGYSQQGDKLVAGDKVAPGVVSDASFGSSVAMSGDGTTALVGSYKDAGGAGSAWVFTRSGSSWKPQGDALRGAGESGAAWFGKTVALSEDGNTALIGGPQNETTEGAVWIFTRSGSTWTQQAVLKSPSRGTSRADLAHGVVGGAPSTAVSFGSSVALSADGNTALIGASAYGDFSGAAFVFRRTGTTWAVQGKALLPNDTTQVASVGTAAGLSADGSTALVGGSGDANGAGAVWEFKQAGTAWTQVGKKIALNGSQGLSAFGCSLSVSSTATIAVIGACSANNDSGAAWIFTRSGAAWQQRTELKAGPAAVGGSFGYSVGLSSDGTIAVIGAPSATNSVGAGLVFTGAGSAWTKTADLAPKDPAGPGGFGFSVGMSGDGKTTIAGAPNDDSGAGAAYVQA